MGFTQLFELILAAIYCICQVDLFEMFVQYVKDITFCTRTGVNTWKASCL